MRRLTCGSLFDGVGMFSLAFARAGFDLRWSVEIDRECRRVTAERFPGVAQHEDVRNVGSHDLGPVDVVFGGSPCFVAGTLILTAGGLRPIEDVRVGEMAWTHAGRYRRVTHTFRRQAEETVTLRGGTHFGLRCTPGHPIYASAGRVRKYHPQQERRPGHWYGQTFAEPRWVAAKDLAGNYWASPVTGGDGEPPAVGDVEAPLGQGATSRGPAVTPELMWVAGAWVGDGWVRRRKDRGGLPSTVIISCPREHVPGLADRVSAAGLSSCVTGGRTADRVLICSRALCEWLLANFGEKCEGKRVPGWLFTASRAYREAFLAGYSWTDGWEKPNGDVKITTVNRALAFGTAILGNSLGYCSSVYFTRRPATTVIEGRTVNQQDSYEVEIRSFRKQTSSFTSGVNVFSKVRSVTPSGPAEVFNLEVEEDNSYVADGVVSHNCQDWSVAGRRKGLDGERSRLFDHLPRVAREVGASWIVFENVPGLHSQNRGEDFALVLGEFTGCHPEVPPGGWGDGGFGFGPTGAVAWRVLDAQHFGLAQRRKRVFAVVRLGDFSRVGQEGGGRLRGLLPLPLEVLAIPQSMSWHPPPGRCQGQGVATAVTPGARRASAARSGEQLAVTDAGVALGAHGVRERAPTHEVAPCLQERSGKGPDSDCTAALVFEGGGAVEPDVWQGHGGNVGPMGALRAGNGNESGGVPFVAVIQDCRAIEKGQNGTGAVEADVSYTLDSTGQQGVITAAETAPCLRTNHHNNSDAAMEAQMLVAQAVAPPVTSNPYGDHEAREGLLVAQSIGFYPTGGTRGLSEGEVPSPSLKVGSGVGIPSGPAVAFHVTQDPISGPIAPAMGAGNKQGCGTVGVAHSMTVRRLTPTECCRLQGVPDDWLDLAEGKPLPDSVRYRQLGNGGAVPVMFWIAARLAAAEASLLGDPDFEAVCELAARGDLLARSAVQDWLEERLGVVCRRH